MSTDTAWKIVLSSVVICIFGLWAILTCVQMQTIHELHLANEKQAQTIAQLNDTLWDLEQAHEAHVLQQGAFQEAMKSSAAKAGYWWAFVRLSREGRWEEGQVAHMTNTRLETK
jgi:hypothetical protein